MDQLKVGIDNYGLLPLQLEPLEVLKWAHAHGAEGVQFSGLEPAVSEKIDRAYLHDLKQYAASENMYLEWGGAQHIPRDMDTWARKEISEINRKAAEEAAILGTRVVRSCSGGLMRWDPDSPATEALLEETAEALRSQQQMLRDHQVTLSIEIHFEFTTHELLRLMEMCEAEPGDYLGICLDTMNLLTMLEDPLQATERILPWVTSTHMKDGGLLLTTEGLVSFPTAIGGGVIDLPVITSRLAQIPGEVNLSIEDHGGSFLIPVFDSRFLAGFPDLSLREYSRLIHMAQITAEMMDEGRCVVTEREQWPEICEERMIGNIQRFKEIILRAGEVIEEAEQN